MSRLSLCSGPAGLLQVPEQADRSLASESSQAVLPGTLVPSLFLLF